MSSQKVTIIAIALACATVTVSAANASVLLVPEMNCSEDLEQLLAKLQAEAEVGSTSTVADCDESSRSPNLDQRGSKDHISIFAQDKALPSSSSSTSMSNAGSAGGILMDHGKLQLVEVDIPPAWLRWELALRIPDPPAIGVFEPPQLR